MSTAPDRDTLHQLIDALRPEDVPTAQRMLQALNGADRLLATLAAAPLDDEPETESEQEAVVRARQDVQSGNTISNEEVTRNIRRP